jgi:hypothetical protein
VIRDKRGRMAAANGHLKQSSKTYGKVVVLSGFAGGRISHPRSMHDLVK